MLYSRWDNAPGRTGGSGIHLYSVNPDGTDVELLYGAQSHTTSITNPSNGAGCPAGLDCTVQFVNTRPLQDGRLLALTRPTADADFGGNLAVIDTDGYVENNQAVPDTGYPTSTNGRAGRDAKRRAHPDGQRRASALARRPLRLRRFRFGTAPTACSSAGTSAAC